MSGASERLAVREIPSFIFATKYSETSGVRDLPARGSCTRTTLWRGVDSEVRLLRS